MMRIIFCLKKQFNPWEMMKIQTRMIVHKVPVFFISSKDYDFPSKKALYVTDDNDTYNKIVKQNYDALVLIESENDMNSFEKARYFIMNPWDTEYSYYDRAYKRFNNIPWALVATKRLILRETIESDVEAFYEMYKNPEMTKYTERLYTDVEEEKKYVREYREKVYDIQGFGIWTVVRKNDKKIIGRAGITAREGFDNYEVGFAIGCDYQGQGYAIEAVKGICSFAKEQELGKLNALVMAENERSKNLLRKLDFKKREETSLNGVFYEVWRQ